MKLNEPPNKLTSEAILVLTGELQVRYDVFICIWYVIECISGMKINLMLHFPWLSQPLYKQLIIYDLEGAIERNIETYMWNDCFKTPLTHFQRHDKTLFHFVIEIGVGFYLGFIHDVGIHFDISFIKYVNKFSFVC